MRVVVADDHAMFRQGLVSMLGETDDIEVVGQPRAATRRSS